MRRREIDDGKKKNAERKKRKTIKRNDKLGIFKKNCQLHEFFLLSHDRKYFVDLLNL